SAGIRGETCQSLGLRMQPPLLPTSSPDAFLRVRPSLSFYGVKSPARQFKESSNWRPRLRLVTSAGSRTRTLLARTSTWSPIHFGRTAANAPKNALLQYGIFI